MVSRGGGRLDGEVVRRGGPPEEVACERIWRVRSIVGKYSGIVFPRHTLDHGYVGARRPPPKQVEGLERIWRVRSIVDECSAIVFRWHTLHHSYIGDWRSPPKQVEGLVAPPEIHGNASRRGRHLVTTESSLEQGVVLQFITFFGGSKELTSDDSHLSDGNLRVGHRGARRRLRRLFSK